MEESEMSPMARLAESFNEGGSWMYPITLLGGLLPLLALGFLVVGFVSKSNRALPLSIVLLVLAVLPPALGAMGARFARADAAEAIAMASPEDQEVIRIGTESELLNLTLWGLWAALLPGVAGCALLGVGLSRLPRFATRPR